jgi:hypothetical protein
VKKDVRKFNALGSWGCTEKGLFVKSLPGKSFFEKSLPEKSLCLLNKRFSKAWKLEKCGPYKYHESSKNRSKYLNYSKTIKKISIFCTFQYFDVLWSNSKFLYAFCLRSSLLVTTFTDSVFGWDFSSKILSEEEIFRIIHWNDVNVWNVLEKPQNVVMKAASQRMLVAESHSLGVQQCHGQLLIFIQHDTIQTFIFFLSKKPFKTNYFFNFLKLFWYCPHLL